jgi:hypothetical protein
MQPPAVGRSARRSDHLFYGKGQGAICAARFFCGGFPFFAPQKNQKNRETVQK